MVADETVNMLHVMIPGVLGLSSTEIVIGHAQSHADYPKNTACPQSAAVSGFADLVSTNITKLEGSTTDFVSIPPSGGSQSATADDASVQGLLGADNGSTSTTGAITPQVSGAFSVAQLSDLNVLGGVITASLIKEEANSVAYAGGPSGSNAAGTQLANLVVAGHPISGTPAPNTTITIPNVGYLVLNEQIPDGPVSNSTHTGITVRALDLVIDGYPNIVPGTRVIVAEAHSGAQR